jgi:hypothetical protein
MPHGKDKCPCIDKKAPTCPCPNCQPEQDDGLDDGSDDIKQRVIDDLLKDPRFKGNKECKVSDEELAVIAAAVYEMMLKDPTFRGPPGPPGKDGLNGKDGGSGQVSPDQLERIKQEVLASLPKIRVIISDENNKVIDDESYELGMKVTSEMNFTVEESEKIVLLLRQRIKARSNKIGVGCRVI